MPHESSWKQFLKTSFFYLLFIGSIVCGFFALFVVDTFFRIHEITVIWKGPKLQVVGLSAFDRTNMIFLQEEKAEKMLEQDNPGVERAEVVKDWPGKLEVTLYTQPPVAALLGDNGYYILSANGTILQKTREEPKNLPKITYYQKLPFINFQAGEKVDFADLIISMDIFARLGELGFKVQSIDIKDYSEITFQLEDKQILVSALKDKDAQWYQIERLIKELTIRGQNFKIIDVRFEKPFYQE